MTERWAGVANDKGGLLGSSCLRKPRTPFEAAQGVESSEEGSVMRSSLN